MAEADGKQRDTQDEGQLKVTDRRLFTVEGKLRGETLPEAEDAVVAETPGAAAARAVDPGAGAGGGPGFERRAVEEPRGVDFTMLINAMAEPALVFLGEIQHPGLGRAAVDLERARLQIDMLDLLRVKCRGNLTVEEDGLLDRILYQLRMLYVARANQPQT
jgi:hypothetical protein